MFRMALLNLLKNRYETDLIKQNYIDVKNLSPENISEEVYAHMEKLSDIMSEYDESRAYDLRNLISYHLLPSLDKLEKHTIIVQ